MTPDQPHSERPDKDRTEPEAKAVPLPTPIPDQDDEIDFGEMPVSDGDSRAISRSQLSGPLSGTSIVSWADLMKARAEEDPEFRLDELDGIEVDAASDRDLLAKALQAEPPSGTLRVDAVTDAELTDNDQTSSVVGRTGESSRVDLLNDVKAKGGSSQQLSPTDELDSPMILGPDDDDTAAEIGGIPMGGIESSAVDLGSQSVIDLPFPVGDSDVRMPGSGRRERKSGTGDSGSVDLLGSDQAPGLSSIPGLTAVASGARPDSGLPETVPMGLASRSTGWIGGGLLGGLTGVAVCVGVWLTGAVPGSAPKPPAPAAGALAPDLSTGLTLLDAGEIDKAIVALGKLEKSAAVNAAMGQARILRLLRDARLNNAVLNANDPEVQTAEAELKAADTPSALLWLGLLNESLGKPDVAKTVYLEAAERFKDQERLFRTALDRLDVRPVTAAPRAEAAPFGATLYTLLLQAEPPVKDEAGFEFWKAVRLAKTHKYSEAQTALAAARAAHDQRRLALARRGLNPTSDPLEEAFLRCCDEIREYWLIRAQIHAATDLTKQPSPGAALAALIASSRKNADDARALQTRLAGIRDALSQSGLDLNDLTGSVNKLVQAMQTAEGKIKAAETDAKSAREAAVAAQAMAKQAETQLAAMKQTAVDADEARKKLETELTRAREQLSAMKPAPTVTTPPANADVARLNEERERLEARVKELTDQLAVARQAGERSNAAARELTTFVQAVKDKVRAAPDARPADVLTGLDAALATRATRTDLPPVPPASLTSDPRAERAFALGLTAMRAGDLIAAEQKFQAAIAANGYDARYWYFLGLTRYSLGRSDEAVGDFRQGVERELRNLPNPGVIDASLERLSADARAVVNQARGRR